MIDLSITKDPEWIKRREAAWKKVYERKKEDTRTKTLKFIKHYFMTGTLLEGSVFQGNLNLFPIQSLEGWDYYLQFLASNAKEFEQEFYYQFSDISHDGLSPEEELALWDYFAGDTFKPVVSSRVPIGRAAKVVSFQVRLDYTASSFGGNLESWVNGEYGNNPKWVQRNNYYLSSLKFFPETIFLEKNESGNFLALEGRLIKSVFICVCNPQYGSEHPLDEEGLRVRQEFIHDIRQKLNVIEMPPAMRKTWEDVKAEYGV